MRRNFRDVLRPRGDELVKRWAAKLPATGWSGSIPALRDALTKLARWGDHVPANCVNMTEDGLVGTGFRLIRRRDREGRYVVIERVKP